MSEDGIEVEAEAWIPEELIELFLSVLSHESLSRKASEEAGK